MATEHLFRLRSEIRQSALEGQRRGLFRFFPPATRAELWGGVALVALSLVGTAWVLKCRSHALALEQNAVTIEGKVLRLWVTRGKGSGLHVAYEYPVSLEVGAQAFQGETKLDKDYWAQLREGGPLAVRVCRTDPANHQVVGERPRTLASTAALAFCLGLLALVALTGLINLWWWWFGRGRMPPAQVFLLGVKSVRIWAWERSGIDVNDS